MQFVSFESASRPGFGALVGDAIADLTGASPGRANSLRAFIAEGMLRSPELAARIERAPRLRLTDVRLVPVIPDAAKIVCVGTNYHDHRIEAGRAETRHPVLFLRLGHSHVGHGEDLVLPAVSNQFDFEGELAVVIGRPCRAVPVERALEYVAGYACYNDGSIRDWQFHTHQFTPGKNFPRTGAFGPALVTPDDVGPLDELTLVTRINGTEVQSAKVADLIFRVPELINYISTFMPLEPGDVIVTGTPGGVGFKRTPPLFLAVGDVVEVDISRVGCLKNGVREEAR